MRTHNIPSCWRKSKRYPYYASWPGSIINLQWLELPLSRTNFHSPKGVRAIEVRLYIVIRHYELIKSETKQCLKHTERCSERIRVFLLFSERLFGSFLLHISYTNAYITCICIYADESLKITNLWLTVPSYAKGNKLLKLNAKPLFWNHKEVWRENNIFSKTCTCNPFSENTCTNMWKPDCLFTSQWISGPSCSKHR